MPGRQHAERLWTSLMQLGARRLAALAAIGLAVFLTVGFGAYYLSRPSQKRSIQVWIVRTSAEWVQS